MLTTVSQYESKPVFNLRSVQASSVVARVVPALAACRCAGVSRRWTAHSIASDRP
jgi:hypothetical protein